MTNVALDLNPRPKSIEFSLSPNKITLYITLWKIQSSSKMMPLLQGLNASTFYGHYQRKHLNENPTEHEEILENDREDSIKFIFLGPIGIFILLLVGCCCLCKLYDVCKYQVLGHPSEYEPLLPTSTFVNTDKKSKSKTKNAQAPSSAFLIQPQPSDIIGGGKNKSANVVNKDHVII